MTTNIIRIVFTSTLLFICSISWAQKSESSRKSELSIYFGYTYKVTPIPISSYSIYYGPWILSTNEHVLLTGSRLYYGIQVPIYRNISIRASQYFRYGYLYSEANMPDSIKTNTYYLGNTVKRLTTDLSLEVMMKVPLKKASINITLGYSWMNLGSSYSYTIYKGNSVTEFHNSDLHYHGPSLGALFSIKKLDIGLNFIYVPNDNNKFVYTQEFIIPEIKALYKIGLTRKN